MSSGNSPGAPGVKPYFSIKQQIEKLKEKGCIIPNEKRCRKILREVSYYRLSGYFRLYRQKDGTYQKGLTFDKVYGIYEFDRKLRSILFSALATIEISFKARIAKCHAKNHGPLGYLDPANFAPWHDHQRFLRRVTEEVALNGKIPFVLHHVQKYNGQFPLWAMTELFTFGMTSKFYADMITFDKKVVAGGKLNYRNVVSWLRCATDLRNICAHHARLYGYVFAAAPRSINVPQGSARSLWATILCLKELYPSATSWNKEILQSLKKVFKEYAGDIDLGYIHFPADWAVQLKKAV